MGHWARRALLTCTRNVSSFPRSTQKIVGMRWDGEAVKNRGTNYLFLNSVGRRGMAAAAASSLKTKQTWIFSTRNELFTEHNWDESWIQSSRRKFFVFYSNFRNGMGVQSRNLGTTPNFLLFLLLLCTFMMKKEHQLVFFSGERSKDRLWLWWR